MNTPAPLNPMGPQTAVFGSLRIVWGNIPYILGLFLLLHAPIYLLSALINHSELAAGNLQPEDLNSAAGPLAGLLLIALLGYLAYIVKVIAIAKVVEDSLLGREISFGSILRHGFSLFGKGLLVSIPLFLLEVLIILVAALAVVGLKCLGLIFFVPLIFLGIYQLLVLIAVSLRGQAGGKAYSFAWNLAGGEWINLFGNYVIMAVIAGIVTLPVLCALMGLNSVLGDLTPLVSVISDFLSVFIVAGMTLLFLEIERQKNRPPAEVNPFPGLLDKEN